MHIPCLAACLSSAILAASPVWAQENSANPPDVADTAAAPSVSPSTLDASARLRWIVKATVGPKNLAAGVFVSGIRTWSNSPDEYGPHWDGFAKRYGMRLTVGGTINALEGGIGSIWGEDPRYYPATGRPLKSRLGRVVKMAFVAHNSEGDTRPAYARYVAIPGGILISNTWRPDTPSTMGRVSAQVGMSFATRIVSNAFSEFLPDIFKRLKRGRRSDTH